MFPVWRTSPAFAAGAPTFASLKGKELGSLSFQGEAVVLTRAWWMIIFIFRNSCVVRVNTQNCYTNLIGLVECHKTDGINVSNNSSTSVFEDEEVDVNVPPPPPFGGPFIVPLHVLLSIRYVNVIWMKIVYWYSVVL